MPYMQIDTRYDSKLEFVNIIDLAFPKVIFEQRLLGYDTWVIDQWSGETVETDIKIIQKRAMRDVYLPFARRYYGKYPLPPAWTGWKFVPPDISPCQGGDYYEKENYPFSYPDRKKALDDPPIYLLTLFVPYYER